MTRGERKALLGMAIVLAIVCSALFARAVLAQRAADLAHAQVRAALVLAKTSPKPDVADRMMLDWSGDTELLRYWQALQNFRIVTGAANKSTQYTLAPALPIIFKLEVTEASLRKLAAGEDSRMRSSRLEDMLGLAYTVDAELHAGEFPVEPQLVARAIAAFREAVLLDGTNAPAKTNLELMLRAQLRHRQAGTKKTKPIPDTGRAEGLVKCEASACIPSQNGAVGLRVHGGY